MFEFFRKYLKDKIDLTGQDYGLIESVSFFKKLRKHQYLLQAGEVCRFNAFVCQGWLLTPFLNSSPGLPALL